MKKLLLTIAIFVSGFTTLQGQNILLLQSGPKSGIRGLSVVDNTIAWASGSNGWTALTTDGGTTWKWNQIPGYEKFDFRDIEAFSSSKAVIVSAGSPAVILLTNNGGLSWKEVYRNNSPEIFLDGMDFMDNNRGIIYGDPINGKMQLLRTSDGGLSWVNISEKLKVDLESGEASFAASGTGIRTLKNGTAFIVTGGMQSRIFVSRNFGKSWKVFPCPIVQGKNSTGPFSMAFLTSKKGIVVGGDYLSDTSSANNSLITKNGGKIWHSPNSLPSGYKSSVEYITPDFLIATGTSGTDISENGGKDWIKITDEGFNVVRKAKSGDLVLFGGADGKISILERQ